MNIQATKIDKIIKRQQRPKITHCDVCDQSFRSARNYYNHVRDSKKHLQNTGDNTEEKEEHSDLQMFRRAVALCYE